MKERIGRQCLIRRVGVGSNWKEAELDLLIITETEFGMVSKSAS